MTTDKYLYHYISFENLLKILSNNAIRLTNVLSFPDPGDYPLNNILINTGSHKISYADISVNWPSRYFAFCFSKDYNSDALWRSYGYKNACCLKFNMELFKDSIEMSKGNCFLKPIRYVLDLKKPSCLNDLGFNLEKQPQFPGSNRFDYEFDEKSDLDLCFLKRKEFSYENEVRLIYRHEPFQKRHEKSRERKNKTTQIIYIEHIWLNFWSSCIEEVLFSPFINENEYLELVEKLKKNKNCYDKSFYKKCIKSDLYEKKHYDQLFP